MKNFRKNFSKFFIVPQRSLGHTDHIYTYERYIEHVGFTKKLQKTTKIAFFGQNKAQIKKPTSLFYKTFNFTYITRRRSHSVNFLLNKIFKLKFEVGYVKT